MSMMISEVYDALRSANADEDKARAAATALAVNERRIEDQFSALLEDNTKMRGEIVLVRWMLTILTGIAIAIAFRVFTV